MPGRLALDAALATGPSYPLRDLQFPRWSLPRRRSSVGLNYRTHIEERGRDVPTYPTLFAKYSRDSSVRTMTSSSRQFPTRLIGRRSSV